MRTYSAYEQRLPVVVGIKTYIAVGTSAGCSLLDIVVAAR
jgi:hypothetical protein